MFKSKRKLKNKKSSIWQLILPFVVFSILLIVVIFAYQMYLGYLNKRPFISPVPISLPKIESIKAPEDTAINNLKSLLEKNKINYSSLYKNDSALLVKLAGGEEILFSEGKVLDEQISSLQLILSRLTIEGKRFNRIDFRFDKPIIQLR